MMAVALPPEDIWFALRWKRLWPVRRDGNVVIAKLFAGLVLSTSAGALLAVFARPAVAAQASGFAASFCRLCDALSYHADYSVSYDDYFRENDDA